MKRQLVSLFLTVLAVGSLLFPRTADAFTLTASDFDGYLAYDRGGDVISRFGLDPRFSYDNSGQRFNTAAGMDFSFNYDPSTPSLNDIMADPNTKYRWRVELSGLEWPNLPTSNLENKVRSGFKDGSAPALSTSRQLPGLSFTSVASFNDMKQSAGSAWSVFTGFFPTEGCYLMDLDWTTGTGSLSMAANIDYGPLGMLMPKKFMRDFASDAQLTVSASPVPEPLTMVLFGTGLAGIGLVRRRKNAVRG